MNILLVNIPSRRGKGGFTLPLGLLYAASIIKRSGHKAKIFDPYLEDSGLADFDLKDFSRLDKIIQDYKPAIVGYGGIATSYGRTKTLSRHIKEKYPEIFQIAGGPLSSVYNLLLTKTDVDLVFHGETEASLPVFLQRFEKERSFSNIEGVSFCRDGNPVRTKEPIQIADLDTIPIPDYSLIDMNRYLHSIADWAEAYQVHRLNNTNFLSKIGNKKYYIPIITARGCTHKCLFCYRHMRGIRQNSVEYVIEHIKYLKGMYGIDGFQFCDELFNHKPDWVLEFCDSIEKEKLDIFYLIAGARVDRISEEMLRRLKETGCIEINYGHESGSDVILKEYNKGVTSRQNKDITLLTKKVGLNCPIQLVIGSPSETSATIHETLKFLNEVEAYAVSSNYLIPLPESPIWEYVERNHLIDDVEKYLDLVADSADTDHVNLTKVTDRIWKDWQHLIAIERKVNYMKRAKSRLYWIAYFAYKVTPSLLAAMVRYRHDNREKKRAVNTLKTVNIYVPVLSIINLPILFKSIGGGKIVLHCETLPRYLRAVSRILKIPQENIALVISCLIGITIKTIKHNSDTQSYRDMHLDIQERSSSIAEELIPILENDRWIFQMEKLIGKKPAMAYAVKQIVTYQIFKQILPLAACYLSLEKKDNYIAALDCRLSQEWFEVIARNLSGIKFKIFMWPRWYRSIRHLLCGIFLLPRLVISTLSCLFRKGMTITKIGKKRYKVITEFIDPERLNNTPYDVDYWVDGVTVNKKDVLFFLSGKERKNLVRRGYNIKKVLNDAKAKGYEIRPVDDFSYPLSIVKELLVASTSILKHIFHVENEVTANIFIKAWAEYVDFFPLFSHCHSDNFIYLTFPNGQTDLRYNSAIVTALCRKSGIRSIGCQTRAIHSRNHDYCFDCFDVYLAWGQAWCDMLAQGLRFIDKKVIVGCIYLDHTLLARREKPAKDKERPRKLQVCIFPSDISPKHHYSYRYALSFMKNCARLAIAHRDINFVIKSKEPEYTKIVMSDPEFRDVYSRVKGNFTFFDRRRHEYMDLLVSADIIIAIGFTTPGAEGLLSGKRTIYYNELKYGGQAFSRIPDLVATDYKELAILFEKALRDYDKYADAISSSLNGLDPFRDGQALERIKKILGEGIL